MVSRDTWLCILPKPNAKRNNFVRMHFAGRWAGHFNRPDETHPRVQHVEDHNKETAHSHQDACVQFARSRLFFLEIKTKHQNKTEIGNIATTD